MPLPKVYKATFTAVFLLMGCGFWMSGDKEADGATDAGKNVLYYQLAGDQDKGWQLTDEEKFTEVERLVVVSSTMLGFRRKLHFDKLVPLETEFLKKERWHVISFEQREPTEAEEGSEESSEEGSEESGELLLIKLEWLNDQGEVERASVQVNSPSSTPPTRDAFDELFGLYVARVVAGQESAGMPRVDAAASLRDDAGTEARNSGDAAN